jgi:hypothetical protein
MRYFSVPTIGFTGADGVTRATKDLREIPAYAITKMVRRQALEPIDFTAQRSDVFGPRQELNSYALWEANHVMIVELGFDLTQLQALMVPVVRNS